MPTMNGTVDPPPPPGGKRRTAKGLGRNLLLLLGSLVTVVLLCELVLRLFSPVRFPNEVEYIPDAYLGVRLTPDRSYALLGGGTCSVDSLGFRGAGETAWEKRPGSIRIVVLGGSAAFCFHTRDEAIWTQLLEDTLRSHYGRDVEVINAGVPGYSTFESKIHYFYRVRPLSPDVVVVYHTWNDMKFFHQIERDGVALREAYRRPRLRSFARRTQIGWRIRNFLHTRVRPRKRENTIGTGGGTVAVPAGGRAHRWARANFEDLATLLERDGVLPVFASQAGLLSSSSIARHDVREVSYIEYVGFSFDETVAQWEATSRIIEDVSREHGIPFIDVRASVPANRQNFIDHVHLTDEGNVLVAEAFFRGFVASAAIDSVLRAGD